MDELPKFNETFGPILRILADGEVLHHRELIKKVQSEYYADLPDELLDLKTKRALP